MDLVPIQDIPLMVGLYLFIQIMYFTILEGFLNSSIGKRLCKLKVVKDDYTEIGLGTAFVRNFLRLVDMLPVLYLIGGILILRSSNKQRLGDRIAGTIVVGKPSPQRLLQTKTTKVKGAKSTPYTKFCINCGSNLIIGALYCPQCGEIQPPLLE